MNAPTFDDLAYRDLRRACAHEAGHFTIARSWGDVMIQAQVWANYDPDDPPSVKEAIDTSLFLGRCGFPDDIDLGRLRLGSIAGAVAELVDLDEDLDVDDIWIMMSAPDREPFGAFDADAVLAAAAEVSALLKGPLADNWRRAMTVLMAGEDDLFYTPDASVRDDFAGVDPWSRNEDPRLDSA